MTAQEVKDYLIELGMEGTIVYDDYPDAFLGISNDDRAVYSYEKMVECLMERDGMTEEEAMDFLHFNTLCMVGEGFHVILLEKNI